MAKRDRGSARDLIISCGLRVLTPCSVDRVPAHFAQRGAGHVEQPQLRLAGSSPVWDAMISMR